MEINLLKLELDYVFPFSLKPSTPFGKRKGERDRNIYSCKNHKKKKEIEKENEELRALSLTVILNMVMITILYYEVNVIFQLVLRLTDSPL